MWSGMNFSNVLTKNGIIFSSGAVAKEMRQKDPTRLFRSDNIQSWNYYKQPSPESKVYQIL